VAARGRVNHASPELWLAAAGVNYADARDWWLIWCEWWTNWAAHHPNSQFV